MLEIIIIGILGILVVIEGIIISLINSNYYLIERNEDKRKWMNIKKLIKE